MNVLERSVKEKRIQSLKKNEEWTCHRCGIIHYFGTTCLNCNEKNLKIKMNGQWLHSNYDIDWSHDTFNTKAEAMYAAKLMYGESFYVGQLEYQGGFTYNIINIEKIQFSTEKPKMLLVAAH